MFLTYFQLLTLMLTTSLITGGIVYFWIKRKMKLIKEESQSMRLSLAGMWDNNSNWDKKYTALKADYQELLQQKDPSKKKTPNSMAIKHIQLPNSLAENSQRFEA